MTMPGALAAWHAVAQGLLNTWHGRRQRSFIQAISQAAIPGDAHKGSDVPAQIVHRPGDRIRYPRFVEEDTIVLAVGVIVEVRLMLEAVEAQELYRLALHIAEDLQGWPPIGPGIAILNCEAQAAGFHPRRVCRYAVA
jgi:hypothetical protein